MAPSGENAQPWRFRVRELDEAIEVDLILETKADVSLYNHKNRAAFVALGAAAENMRIAATAHQLSTTILPYTASTDEALAARIIMQPAIIKKDLLSDHIKNRATNRKPFETAALKREEIASLEHSSTFPQVSVQIFEAQSIIKSLAHFGSTNEEIMLGNQQLHDFFFSHVNWSHADDERKRTGFFIKTLELPPPARIGFKVLRSWSRARVLNRILKFNRIVAGQNASIYAKASAYGVISADDDSLESAFMVGRAFERVWLEATAMGLQFQPLMGTLFLAYALREKAAGLSTDESSLIQSRYEALKTIVAPHKRVVLALFRVGRGKPPSARALRKPLEDLIVN